MQSYTSNLERDVDGLVCQRKAKIVDVSFMAEKKSVKKTTGTTPPSSPKVATRGRHTTSGIASSQGWTTKGQGCRGTAHHSCLNGSSKVGQKTGHSLH